MQCRMGKLLRGRGGGGVLRFQRKENSTLTWKLKNNNFVLTEYKKAPLVQMRYL